jgi:hypothetical protein
MARKHLPSSHLKFEEPAVFRESDDAVPFSVSYTLPFFFYAGNCDVYEDLYVSFFLFR